MAGIAGGVAEVVWIKLYDRASRYPLVIGLISCVTSVYQDMTVVLVRLVELQSTTEVIPPCSKWAVPPVNCDGRTMMTVANIPSVFSVLKKEYFW